MQDVTKKSKMGEIYMRVSGTQTKDSSVYGIRHNQPTTSQMHLTKPLTDKIKLTNRLRKWHICDYGLLLYAKVSMHHSYIRVGITFMLTSTNKNTIAHHI